MNIGDNVIHNGEHMAIGILPDVLFDVDGGYHKMTDDDINLGKFEVGKQYTNVYMCETVTLTSDRTYAHADGDIVIDTSFNKGCTTPSSVNYLRPIKYTIGDMLKVRHGEHELTGEVTSVCNNIVTVKFHPRSEYKFTIESRNVLKVLSSDTILYNESPIPEGTKVTRKGIDGTFVIDYDDHTPMMSRFKLTHEDGRGAGWGTFDELEVVEDEFNVGDDVKFDTFVSGTGVITSVETTGYWIKTSDYSGHENIYSSKKFVTKIEPEFERMFNVGDKVIFTSDDSPVINKGDIGTIVDIDGYKHPYVVKFDNGNKWNCSSIEKYIEPMESEDKLTLADWEFRKIQFGSGEAVEVYNSMTGLVAATFIDKSIGWFRIGNETGGNRKVIYTSEQEKYQE